MQLSIGRHKSDAGMSCWRRSVDATHVDESFVAAGCTEWDTVCAVDMSISAAPAAHCGSAWRMSHQSARQHASYKVKSLVERRRLHISRVRSSPSRPTAHCRRSNPADTPVVSSRLHCKHFPPVFYASGSPSAELIAHLGAYLLILVRSSLDKSEYPAPNLHDDSVNLHKDASRSKSKLMVIKSVGHVSDCIYVCKWSLSLKKGRL